VQENVAADPYAAIESYVASVAAECSGIRSIWLIGSRVDGNATATSDWDLLAFGSTEALECLRRSPELHRSDVDFLVVTDGNTFRNAWGNREKTGSFSLWEWKAKSDVEAEYTSAKAVPGEKWGGVALKRHRAVLLWSVRRPAL
jgi:predicted nucleotidyltransferase